MTGGSARVRSAKPDCASRSASTLSVDCDISRAATLAPVRQVLGAGLKRSELGSVFSLPARSADRARWQWTANFPNALSHAHRRYNCKRQARNIISSSTVRAIPLCAGSFSSSASPDQCRLRVCAVTRRRFPVGASPTRQPLQPEATGAAMEVTKWLKPSDSASRIGDGASVQAETRVNAEQASKRTMRRPTRRPFRERLTRLGERAK